MTLEVDASKLELHLSVLPTGYGDHLAIQFRTPSTLLTLERLGLMPDQRRRLAGLVTKPTGLLLVTGPSGCGMSTTLYALLASLNTGSATIVTLEDRIDYELPGVTQVQAQPEAGLTVAAGLRSILRHDPTVLMVSDVPDRETARLTVQAALTGHVVLAGLRTQDTATAVRRLLDLSVEPFFLCSSVLGIVAQRLVRRLCVSCRQPAAVGAPAFAAMGITPPKSVGMVKAWRARGCERCHRTGYEGRAAIFELLAIDHHIRSLIIKGIPSGSLRQSAMSRGMTGLLEAGWEKVQTGETSLEELLRVFPRERR